MPEQPASPADEPHDVLAADEFAVPAPDPRLKAKKARDVLAAEEFVVPAPDPRLKEREAHDVLAAEEFGMATADRRLSLAGNPIVLPVNPYDPRGADPARDVLAAEEFAMPAPEPYSVPPGYSTTSGGADATRGWLLRAGAAFVVVLAVRSRRRRKAVKRAAKQPAGS